jgi:small subunit ribosomal protein S25e
VVQGKGYATKSRNLKTTTEADSITTVKDKAQHAVTMDKNIQERLNKDVLTYRLITTAVLVDRLKINGSLARRALADLEAQGVIKKVIGHSKLNIYSTFSRSEL